MSYRIRDICLATVLLIISLPIQSCIVILLYFTQGQIFFIHKRPGLHEKPFYLIKFCTMRPLSKGEKEGTHDKERLTYWGKFLKKYSLNELPQLINVIKGEMSLVGPRPLLMEYLPLYTQEEQQRHSVRPGITGWAQIHGRNQLSFKTKFQYDLWYVYHRSHILDICILWQTLIDIFTREKIELEAATITPKFDGTN